ncbi:SPT3 Dosage dependent suppressor of Ty-induced promoter mutations-like protein [Mortierella alpina]|nr:SPT3 Dosage dependent suppressor of Ty-induced promoter mutations-like protein [Mortierella alpina]
MQLPYLDPPPSRPAQPCSLQIEISGIPAENGKCRVETQLKIGFHLRGVHGGAIMGWKQLRLPRALIAKEKHRMDKFNGRDKHLLESEILTLDTRLVCDHDMTKVLECCNNCIGRERKRAHRRKESLKLPGPLASIPVFGAINPKNKNANGFSHADECDPPTPTDPVQYQAWERSRIMVFSSTEYVDISAGECMLPTRITCYCRHHNEKVGFRIQFTARDSTGAIVASVLTNPVMMMDDHKSGKRVLPMLTKSVTEPSSKRPGPERSLPNTPALPHLPMQHQDRQQHQYHQHSTAGFSQDQDMDEEDHDDIDLEACHSVPRHIGVKVEDDEDGSETEEASHDVLTPLGSQLRMGCKRRVDDDDENMMGDIRAYQQQSFRRKTSHDLAQYSDYHSSMLTFEPPAREFLSAPSPFMPGSPFANDGEQNAFAPSFAQAIIANGSLLFQEQDTKMFPAHMQRDTSVLSSKAFVDQEQLRVDSSSMMENFTTLDESMITARQAVSASRAGLSSGGSFSVPSSIYHSTTASPYSLSSPITPTYPSTTSATVTCPQKPDASFLDTSHMQEFNTFQRQNTSQQHQQRQGFQHQDHQLSELNRDTWTPTRAAEENDSLQNMKAAITQATSPSSSAFIPIPVSLPENIEIDPLVTAARPLEDDQELFTAGDASVASKQRGRPHKGVAVMPPSTTASGASSPMVSPKAPSTNMPPSPSPPPYLSPTSTSISPLAGIGSTSAAAAAQFLLYQQQQQQQQHQQQQQQQQQIQLHQQQHQHQHQHQNQHHQLLQQQHTQAILNRLHKPRVQKLVPCKGSVEGGIEVTLLGSGFFPAMVPTFDGVPALNVQFYGSETVICTAPPRAYPGSVVVKAHNCPLGPEAALNTTASGPVHDPAGVSNKHNNSINSNGNNELNRTMSHLFGGPSAASLTIPNNLPNNQGDDDVGGVVFEYEEDKGDRDLIALALQVLGMKMNGRVEPPHQVAMRIMGTAAAQQQRYVNQQNAMMAQQNSLALMAAKSSCAPTTSATWAMAATTTARSKTATNLATAPATAPLALTPIPLQSPQSQLLFQTRQEKQHEHTPTLSDQRRYSNHLQQDQQQQQQLQQLQQRQQQRY